jgi:hypothetical protein
LFNIYILVPLFLTKSLSGHETTRRRGVEFGNDQTSSGPRQTGRHMSVAHHGPIHDVLSNAGGSASIEHDPNRSSVVSCLVPTSVAVAAR